MRRRDFIGGLACALATCPPMAEAQSSKMPTIGVLVLGSPDPEPFFKAIREGLQKLGYVEGQSVSLVIRSANGNASALKNIAAELVNLKVNIIVAFQTPAAQAVKQATTEIPVVMIAGDPVGTGLVASLARPGGNLTGVSGAGGEIAGKTVELVREMIPFVRRVGVLASTNDPFAKPFLSQIKLAGRGVDIVIDPIMVRPAQEFATAFADMAQNKDDAVILQPSLLREDTVELAIKRRLPTFAPFSLLPRMGGLASYSANYSELYPKVAVFIDKILKGVKPADLPIELPTKFELIINLKTARAIGLEVSPTMLLRADEVIE